MADPARFELTTSAFGGQSSMATTDDNIHLSSGWSRCVLGSCAPSLRVRSGQFTMANEAREISRRQAIAASQPN